MTSLLPIDAPCTHCLRHGDPMHAQKWLPAPASPHPDQHIMIRTEYEMSRNVGESQPLPWFLSCNRNDPPQQLHQPRPLLQVRVLITAASASRQNLDPLRPPTPAQHAAGDGAGRCAPRQTTTNQRRHRWNSTVEQHCSSPSCEQHSCVFQPQSSFRKLLWGVVVAADRWRDDHGHGSWLAVAHLRHPWVGRQPVRCPGRGRPLRLNISRQETGVS
eukprot:COSAG01_NODE_2443_length_7689_cov_5.414229_5_plen_216_part_00